MSPLTPCAFLDQVPALSHRDKPGGSPDNCEESASEDEPQDLHLHLLTALRPTVGSLERWLDLNA